MSARVFISHINHPNSNAASSRRSDSRTGLPSRCPSGTNHTVQS